MPGVAFQHRGARLLNLEEQGIVGGGKKKRDEAACADAPHAHHLYRYVDKFEAVEQHATLFGKSFAIPLQCCCDAAFV